MRGERGAIGKDPHRPATVNSRPSTRTLHPRADSHARESTRAGLVPCRRDAPAPNPGHRNPISPAPWHARASNHAILQAIQRRRGCRRRDSNPRHADHDSACPYRLSPVNTGDLAVLRGAMDTDVDTLVTPNVPDIACRV